MRKKGNIKVRVEVVFVALGLPYSNEYLVSGENSHRHLHQNVTSNFYSQFVYIVTIVLKFHLMVESISKTNRTQFV